jgi:hypothetical protein
MKHYIITRFSILDADYKAFKFKLVCNNTKVDYTNQLFDKQRLDFKFNVFDKMTYPSIMNQSYTDYEWLIYASSFLPVEYKTKLANYETDKIKIVYVDNFKQFGEHLKNFLADKTDYVTLRLDDDDGLNRDFLKKLDTYSVNKGEIVTFPNGRFFTMENNSVILGNQLRRPFVAIGLAAIGFNIYSAGDHNRVGDKYKIIVDESLDYYSVCCSEYCDTKRKFVV